MTACRADSAAHDIGDRTSHHIVVLDADNRIVGVERQEIVIRLVVQGRDVLDEPAVHALDVDAAEAGPAEIPLCAGNRLPLREVPRHRPDVVVDALRRLAAAVLEADVAHHAVRRRAELEGVAVRTRHAVADEDVLDREARVVGLEAVRVVARVDVAVLDQDVLRLDVEAGVDPPLFVGSKKSGSAA